MSSPFLSSLPVLVPTVHSEGLPALEHLLSFFAVLVPGALQIGAAPLSGRVGSGEI
jgi:hypothetical protein